MPASSGDPISAALNHSLAQSSKFSCDEENLDSKLIGSAKRVLLSEIKYEQTSSYTNNLLDLKSKYIVLKPTGNVENSGFKLKNGLGLPKAKEISNDVKVTPQGGSPKVLNLNTANSSKSVGLAGSSVLPSPKRVLFPPEKIQLGWQSKSQPVGSGMVNMGNTCYLNSTLQALFHVPAFVNWLLNDKAHKEKCENMNGLTQMENCLVCAVLRTLRSSMENSALNNAIRPHLVYSKLKQICKRLMHGHQEDAHEFLRYLIESMDRSYLKIMRANDLDSYSKETSPLSQIFGGYLRTEVRCLECRNISVTFQHFQDMLLDIRQACAVDEALDAYFSRERLGDGDEASLYKCDKCHCRVQATKQFSVEKPPNVLCIQLKRFGIMGGKNSKHINIQQTLDLTKFWVHRQSQPQSKLSYRLVSLVSHIGPSTNCGHYTAIGNTASGQFYLFDDSSVRPISSHNVSGNNTYIIMYELTSLNPALNGTPTKQIGVSCTVTKPSQPSTSSAVNGTSSFTKCPPSPLTNGNSKLQHSSTPKSPAKLNHTTASNCTKNSSQSSASASPRKSLVPYSAESSDSESEPTANQHQAKNGHSTPLSPLKNGFARESTSCARSSNCGALAKTSASVSAGAEVVNGWKVTKVDRCRNGVVSSPPPNWDVVDTRPTDNKLNNKLEDSNQSKATSSCNGTSLKETTKPALTNGNGHNGHISTENGREEPKKMSNGIHENGRITNGNGKSWDGNRNNTTVDYLRKNSHQGYGPNVTSWNGTKSQVDRELENDRTTQQRKRNYDQMYDEELDQGKIKKIKSNNHYQKNGDRDMNGRPRNYFQEHQNYKNNNWHNRERNNHFYRPYVNSGNYRTYNNRQSNYYYRR